MYDKKLAQNGVKVLMQSPVPKSYTKKRIGNMRAIASVLDSQTMVLLRFDMLIGKCQHHVDYEIPEVIGKPLQEYIDERSEAAKKILEESWNDAAS